LANKGFAMARYVCSLPNRGEPGNPKELISDNPALIKRFIKAEDRPGRGVYECINPLMPGARRRSLETVLELARLYFDLDLPNIEESRDQLFPGSSNCRPASLGFVTAAPATSMPALSSKSRLRVARRSTTGLRRSGKAWRKS